MAAITDPTEQLQVLASGNLGTIEVLLRMHEGNLEASGLDAKTWQLVRIAALATLDGDPMSWLTHLTMAEEVGLSPERILGTLIAIAPVVGTARVVSAAGKIARAMDLEESMSDAGQN